MTDEMINSFEVDTSRIVKINEDIQKKISIEDDSLDVLLLGEIVEHISNADIVLKNLNKKMKKNGLAYFSTAANGPAEDHILLFNTVDEIRNFIRSSNWTIVEEKAITVNNIPLEEAEKNKKNINYCAILKPSK